MVKANNFLIPTFTKRKKIENTFEKMEYVQIFAKATGGKITQIYHTPEKE